MEARDRLARAVFDAMDIMDGLDVPSAQKYADAILKALHLSGTAALALMDDEWCDFEVHESGLMVAATSGRHDQALGEAMRYAQHYAEDGPVTVVRLIEIASLPHGDETNDR